LEQIRQLQENLAVIDWKIEHYATVEAELYVNNKESLDEENCITEEETST
jgi:hypothetical protein